MLDYHDDRMREEYRGLTIEYRWDDYPDHPRNTRESASEIVFWAGHYPDRYSAPPGAEEIEDPANYPWHYYGRPEPHRDGREVYKRAMLIFGGAVAVEDYYIEDRGSIHTGFAYITREVAEREGITDPAAWLSAELAEDRAYYANEVFYYVIKNEAGEDLDSCSGFYGRPDEEAGAYIREAAQQSADYHADERDTRMAANWEIIDAIFRPLACTGYWLAGVGLQHDGDTCPIHEG